MRNKNICGGDPSKVAGSNTEKFNTASRRDAQAARYFSSTEFLTHVHGAIWENIVNKGKSFIELGRPWITMEPKKQDMPYLQKMFDGLKGEYPELNHIRLVKYLNGYTTIVLDTKKNTVLRRLVTRGASEPANA